MSFLKKIFNQVDNPISDYSDFWDWFGKNEAYFHTVVRNKKDIEKYFFEELSAKLSQLKEGYFFLAGMYDDDTVELILTADGFVENIIFVEELVAKAPSIKGWKITALKPPLDIEDVNIHMSGFTFNSENIFFYSNEKPDLPDEIDICIIHKDLNDENKEEIIRGTHIFLDNYLGELDYLMNIDQLKIIRLSDGTKELVPISKLKAFMIWRQKEFIEKYDGEMYDTGKDEYSILKAELKSGYSVIAVVNSNLLDWKNQASHPWIAIMTIKYDGNEHNKMPSDSESERLNILEDEMSAELSDREGDLYVGRQTAENEREIFFACKDFRKISKLFYEIQQKYAKQFEIEFVIYKDKYWQSFERFK